jgi:hypothetical protein
MPLYITVLIKWEDSAYEETEYTLYRHELEEMWMNYDVEQAWLFSYVDPKVIKEWLWDVFCRQPKEVKIEEIKFKEQ